MVSITITAGVMLSVSVQFRPVAHVGVGVNGRETLSARERLQPVLGGHPRYTVGASVPEPASVVVVMNLENRKLL
ncbi:hypothetical protein DPMN_079363 [Dreissena polymorpha]|uniref:Uncharacterized protein n=1 Tax=Dreissena polymorpha TaxID=45954 RepID=A0A9D3YPE0_DREPO|nr:hypothetical protein DPMN_079363 [Dreissena polymorpha]